MKAEPKTTSTLVCGSKAPSGTLVLYGIRISVQDKQNTSRSKDGLESPLGDALFALIDPFLDFLRCLFSFSFLS
jgi:hypothetical protein